MKDTIKKFWGELRWKIISTITDLMIERPNWAIVILLADVLIVLAFFLGSGSDAPLALNE